MTWLTLERPLTKLYQSFYQITKRAFEIIFCLLIMPVFVLLALVIAAAIYLDSPGPIFFAQKRIGKNGRYFDIFKFRTRHYHFTGTSDQVFTEAFIKENPSLPKEVPTDNYTSLGRFLRRTGLDELPELINIFKGDMSFVGPRPLAPREIEAYREWHEDRLSVLPGLTGLAQVRGRRGLLIEEIVQYDIDYINRRGFWLDLKILWWTIFSTVNNK